ncbi:MAG: type II secretion system protein M [Gammaproteobacteria bacterium]
MKDWFKELEQRERMMVIAAAVFVALFLLYSLFLSPMLSKYQSLKENVVSQEENLQWMRTAVAEVRTLRGATASGGQGLGGRSLLSVVDESARSSGLGQQIKRIEPDGNKGVKIWFEQADFDKMIVWLGNLTRSYQIETSNVSIEPQAPGSVNARIILLDAEE